MADPARARRLAKRIATIVATAIDHEIKDPRLAYVTVTDAKVTGDLHDATVFYTVMGPTLDVEPDYAAAAAGLEKATGMLRSKVGAGTGVRFTPTLPFVLDTVPDSRRAHGRAAGPGAAAGRRGRPVAANAAPAGDADPYKAASADEADGPARTTGRARDTTDATAVRRAVRSLDAVAPQRSRCSATSGPTPTPSAAASRSRWSLRAAASGVRSAFPAPDALPAAIGATPWCADRAHRDRRRATVDRAGRRGLRAASGRLGARRGARAARRIHRRSTITRRTPVSAPSTSSIPRPNCTTELVLAVVDALGAASTRGSRTACTPVWSPTPARSAGRNRHRHGSRPGCSNPGSTAASGPATCSTPTRSAGCRWCPLRSAPRVWSRRGVRRAAAWCTRCAPRRTRGDWAGKERKRHRHRAHHR